MITIFFHSLRKSRFVILGWGLVLGALGLFIVLYYDNLAQQQVFQDQLLQAIPPDLMAFMGNIDSLSTPDGYLSLQFFSYIPAILGILAAGQGAAVIASDEEKGYLDILLAHPISRRSYFWGRFVSMVIILAVTLLVTWLGFILALVWSDIGLTPLEMLRPFIVLWIFLTAFAAFSSFLSQMLLSQGIASMIGAFVIIASYIISSLANIISDLEKASKYSPMTYYQGADAINGINWTWILYFSAATIYFGLLAWWRFERRDTRIGGEGGWGGIPLINLVKKGKSAASGHRAQIIKNS